MVRTTPRYARFGEVLGKKHIDRTIETPYDFISIADDGVDATVIPKFMDYFVVSVDVMAMMLNVSPSTLYRWTREKKVLDRNATIQLLELTELFLHGAEIFGGRERFFQWLELPHVAIGGMQPRALLDIPGGAVKVGDLLGRIEHGVYS